MGRPRRQEVPTLGALRDGLTTDTTRWTCGAVYSNGTDDCGGDSCWSMGSYGFLKRFTDRRLPMGFCRRALLFTSRATVDYDDNGCVTIDVRRVLDDKLRAGMRANSAASGRFDTRWIAHATLKDMSWLRDRRGKTYNLNGADFARGHNYLGDTMSWLTVQSGVIRFSPKRAMATQSMAKRRHFGSFCLAIIYNFPSLVYRTIEPGALIAYSAKVHRHHDWLLNGDGISLSHFDTGMDCGVTPVTSMSACDTTASMASGTTVHFGAHPTLTRVVHL
ncbi:unnamed protein product [Peronospora destructor]|uniref:Uncharacterized protein n=1 Tax=Peronospora destructor TaxID=86335 RepID=A0AAV0VEU3_9STRA|nr:unnamed protein product [Peronospora destructor]